MFREARGIVKIINLSFVKILNLDLRKCQLNLYIVSTETQSESEKWIILNNWERKNIFFALMLNCMSVLVL